MPIKKFTSTAWTVDGKGGTSVQCKQGYTVADCSSDQSVGLPHSEKEANALLISAAPEMFEIIAELHAWTNQNQEVGFMYPKIEAAYNKALGLI